MVLRKIIEYDIGVFHSRPIIKKYLDRDDLEMLHDKYNFDFRVIKSRECKQSTCSSVNSEKHFIIGEYYEQL